MAEASTDVETMNEAELGSSEETLESVSNVSTKHFSDIVSCQLEKQRYRSSSKEGTITRVCLLPCGDIVTVYQTQSEIWKPQTNTYKTKTDIKLELLETCIIERRGEKFESFMVETLTNKLPFQLYDQIAVTTMDIALFDRRRVAVAISGTLVKNDFPEQINCVHLVTVTPNIEISSEIKLGYNCEKISCFNNRIYCYSTDLKRSRFIPVPGIEILAMNGHLLKRIQLFDTVSCFCPTKDGGIAYLGTRSIAGKSTHIFRSVTNDGTEVFSHPISYGCKQIRCDVDDNTIGFTTSGNVVLLNTDGSEKRVLLESTGMKVTDEELIALGQSQSKVHRRNVVWVPAKKEDNRINRRPASMCFSDDYKTIIVSGCISPDYSPNNPYKKDFVYSFNVEYSK